MSTQFKLGVGGINRFEDDVKEERPLTPPRAMERGRLAADVEAFLAEGNTIEQVPLGYSTLNMASISQEVQGWFYNHPGHAG